MNWINWVQWIGIAGVFTALILNMWQFRKYRKKYLELLNGIEFETEFRSYIRDMLEREAELNGEIQIGKDIQKRLEEELESYIDAHITGIGIMSELVQRFECFRKVTTGAVTWDEEDDTAIVEEARKFMAGKAFDQDTD